MKEIKVVKTALCALGLVIALTPQSVGDNGCEIHKETMEFPQCVVTHVSPDIE